MAQDSRSIESIFDFAYLDRDRLSAFSAQIFDHGVLTSLKSSNQTVDTIASDMTGGFKPIFTAAEKESLANTAALEKQFDASWTLPLNVLNRLDELGAIKRSLADANLGELVLMKGSINIMDLEMIRNLWEPIMLLEEGNSEQPKTHSQKKEAVKTKAQTKAILEVLKHLPHSFQLRVFNETEQAWCSLKRDCLTINGHDITLKHGPSIAGDWFCLAILDAKPEDENSDFAIPDGSSDIEQMMWNFQLQLRILLGRRLDNFGITPITLFRRVHGGS
ncbi:hypothetical protein A9G00_20750 [Achromobacter xylosoxidans]|nr:hypothetical protein A9G00_20750 [Achromobacter xylosoxidans]